ncbi:plastocyanin [Candidatus Nitrososphaera evergladensis SR1]|jgi:plastocyanin|uniref:Plastocyanin n=1 Tax=Candidatus Nitrososphaera evergladensis SR1 TaxID=1459636 RepID=A0A075MND8_9ARCH|nr:plastocyanin/azurin family copper-binding protein [Candidatus Nitrososphaera evergladensis]AIF83066.1 plastocyanin [Candidatus Nitrososphaera evergladensis SR1]
MSHEHEHDSEPVLRTSPARMARGIAIVGITLAIAGTILMFTFKDMIANPPPVALIKKPTPPPPPPAAGVTQISIPSGASVQGSTSYDPGDAKVPLGNKVVWNNADNAIHTATSGTGASDPNVGKAFDTSLINPGEKSKEIEITGAKVGDSFAYHCTVHPFMTGKITIVEAAAGGGSTGSGSGGAAASGPTVHILSGSSVQGAKAYDPTPVEIKKGDKLTVVNDDSAIHTVTSGTGAEDANAGKAFDSSLLDPGKTVSVDTSALAAGSYDFHCMVHPFMKGKLNVT